MNRTVIQNRTALFVASWFGHTSVVLLLLENGAAASLNNGDCNKSPLMIAANIGHIFVVEVLIKFGAELGFYGITTPFHCAARRGHTALCSYLLDQGIDPNVCEVGGGTSLYLAAKNGHAEVVSLLLSRKADVAVFGDQNKRSPLFIAAKGGHVEIVLLLLQYGSDINQRINEAGTGAVTPLYTAAKNNFESVVEVLLVAGADVNLPSIGAGRSALWAAACFGLLKVVSLLLKFGANVHQTFAHEDGAHMTPLFMARANSHILVQAKIKESMDAQLHAMDIHYDFRADIISGRNLAPIAQWASYMIPGDRWNELVKWSEEGLLQSTAAFIFFHGVIDSSLPKTSQLDLECLRQKLFHDGFPEIRSTILSFVMHKSSTRISMREIRAFRFVTSGVSENGFINEDIRTAIRKAAAVRKRFTPMDEERKKKVRIALDMQLQREAHRQRRRDKKQRALNA